MGEEPQEAKSAVGLLVICQIITERTFLRQVGWGVVDSNRSFCPNGLMTQKADETDARIWAMTELDP
jgi:hypothetical protein